MLGTRRNSEAALRAAERRRRDDAAPRLSVEVPRLETLSLRMTDSESTAFGAIEHTRRVPATAAALFEVPCGNRSCAGGGHDLTREIMHALRASLPHFEGKSACSGSLGSSASQCPNTMKYVATATYRPPR